MKKLISVLLLLILVAGLASGAYATPAKKLTFGFTTFNATADSNTATHFQRIESYAKEKGIDVVMLDPQGDPSTQLRQIENLVEMKVDVIIVRATNALAIIPGLQKAHEAGIPVVVSAVEIDPSGYDYMVAYVGPDNKAEGRAAAGIIKDYYADKKKDSINVLELAHVPGTTISSLRGGGFREGIEGTNIKILDSQTAEGNREKGQQITEAWLLRYQPGKIDALYVQGTGMGFGALSAIKAANRVGEFPVVFIATIGQTYDLIKSGELYGSVNESPLWGAEATLETAIKVANGEKVPFDVREPISVTTKKNVNEVPRPIW